MGLAYTVAPVVEDSVDEAELPPCKVQEYVAPPEAVSTALSPEQIAAGVGTVIDDPAFSETLTLLDAVQPVLVWATVTM